MIASIAKWGNSLAVRIPKDVLRALSLAEGEEVSLVLEDGALILRPARPKLTYRIEDLVAGITAENRHEETATGGALGNEF